MAGRRTRRSTGRHQSCSKSTGLLVRYPLVHRYQRVELTLGSLDELAILHAAPTLLTDGDDLVLLAEETFEPAIEVLVKQ